MTKRTDRTESPLAPNAKTTLTFQAATAALALPHGGPFGKAWEDIGFLIRAADATEDLDRRAFLREQAQKYTVACLRAFLTGRRPPKLRRSPVKTVKRAVNDDSRHDAEIRKALEDDPVLQAMVSDLGQAGLLIGRMPSPGQLEG